MQTVARRFHVRELVFALTTLVVFLSVALPTARAEPRIGERAPDFVGVDSNGKTHKLSDLKGKTVILEWTNHDCPFVQKHYSSGNMQKLQKLATGDGVVWLSVISSAPGLQGHVEPAKANTLTTERDAAPSAVILDPEGEIGRAYNARTTPHMFLIDKNGTLVYKGAIDDKPSANNADVPIARNYVRDALAAHAAGKPVDPDATRPYGCSVKYGS
ncbi:MAG: thioredoxin family protein [Hyphomicrobiaceae bacterium]|nr:thioredoxin family protein [Hyphomicrobiaceae bacterium]